MKLQSNETVRFEPVALNWREVDSPEGGPRVIRVQLSPFGDFPVRDGGPRSGEVQRCSRGSFDALVANWIADGRPDILVDTDHESATGGRTAAAAWAKNLRVEDDGLVCDFELTPEGEALVLGKVYRYVSPAWTLSGFGTPLRLRSVALTNRPNLPVREVGNSRQEGGPGMDFAKIAAALGLGAEATEEEIIGAIGALRKEAAAAAEARAGEFAANAVKAGRAPESALNALRAAHLENAEAAERLLEALAPRVPDKPALNSLGKTPEEPAPAPADPRAEMAALPPAERAQYYRDHAAEIDG